jgi:hypothetical protein
MSLTAKLHSTNPYSAALPRAGTKIKQNAQTGTFQNIYNYAKAEFFICQEKFFKNFKNF